MIKNCRRRCEHCNVYMKTQEDSAGAILECPICGEKEAYYFDLTDQILATMVASASLLLS